MSSIPPSGGPPEVNLDVENEEEVDELGNDKSKGEAKKCEFCSEELNCNCSSRRTEDPEESETKVDRKSKGKKKRIAQNKVMAGPSFFYEDEVYRKTKSGDIEFGMVTENWEMYSSDEEDEEDPDKVPNGHVAVTWHPKGKDEVLPEAKVHLSDRSLMPGDVVRRLIEGKDTQRGYCRSVKVNASVQVLSNKKVIPSVLASELAPVQKLQTDVAVYLDSWIGVLTDIHFRLGLRFGDSSTCHVESFAILDHFVDTKRSDCFGSSETFYPGQRLRGPLSYLRDADWSYCSEEIKRAKDRKIVIVTVTEVEPSSINVNWQWQTPDSEMERKETVGDNKEENGWKGKVAPRNPVMGENLKRIKCLNLFESCTVQLGDISYYTPIPGVKETLIEKLEWKKSLIASSTENIKISSQTKLSLSNKSSSKSIPVKRTSVASIEGVNSPVKALENVENPPSQVSKRSLPKVATRSLRKKKLKKAKPHKVQNNPFIDNKIVVETIHTQSTVDVIWQDGTLEEGMPSTELYPIHHLDDHEFFPGDFVVNADSTDFRTYGVVQTMDHIGRVAHVKWFEAYSLTGDQRPKEMELREMSVYDLKDHPDFRFRPGTIVIRVANMLKDQLAAGQILDNYPDGQVRVWWANGIQTSCWPQDLFRLGDYDSDDGEIWDENDPDLELGDDDDEDGVASDSSWETEAEEEINDSEPTRVRNIGKQIENIQKALVSIREKLVASTPVTASPVPANSTDKPLHTLDRRGIARKLLMIYKDCQYLDKMMGSTYFNEDILRDWFKKIGVTAKSKSGLFAEQMNRIFELPSTPTSASAPAPLPQESSLNDSIAENELIAITEPETDVPEDAEMLVSDLCSLILNKLLAAHAEYLKRFEQDGKKENDGGVESSPESIKLGKKEEGGKAEAIKSSTDLNSNKSIAVKQSPSLILATKETIVALKEKGNNFNMLESVPDTHRYRLTTFLPSNQRSFLKTIQKESAMLREYLPEGIFVKGFEDRIDLYSVMIHGPEKTPYEDGLFFFDIQLPANYPSSPPLVHYVSFCPDRLNPNLYECGKVCVSLLGTWTGKGTEVWTSNSSLLQLLISIQGLILVPEPYYNEAGYEKQRGSQQGCENSRVYNEMVLIKLVQSMSRMKMNLHVPWQKEILSHLQTHGPRLIERYRKWLKLSDTFIPLPNAEKTETDPSTSSAAAQDQSKDYPEFSLLPVSKGFMLTLNNLLDNFAKLCDDNASS